MLIKDEHLRAAILRTLRINEDELNEEAPSFAVVVLKSCINV